MSWILGTDNTGWTSDLGAIWSNATTGNLSDSQKQDIAKEATSHYTPGAVSCADQPTNPACIALENANQQIVDVVAKSNECDGVLNLPGFGCVQSWNSVIYGAVIIVGILVAGYFAILFTPRRIINA